MKVRLSQDEHNTPAEPFMTFNLKQKRMKTIESKQGLRELAMLQYQVEKYRIAGNGFMCQHLNAQIRKLQTQLGQ